MNRSFILPVILGFALMVSFQNCSQGNFESASSPEQVTPTKIELSDDQIQNFLNRDRIEICPMIMCAAPPLGCRYEQDASSNLTGTKNRCPSSCGKLICDRLPPIGEDPPTEPIVCPMIACSEVPLGCQRVAAATTVKDSKGCDLNCGEIKCEDDVQEVFIGRKPPICPMVMCGAPPEGCFYRQTSRLVGSNECTGCGELICKKRPFEVTLPIEPNLAE